MRHCSTLYILLSAGMEDIDLLDADDAHPGRHIQGVFTCCRFLIRRWLCFGNWHEPGTCTETQHGVPELAGARLGAATDNPHYCSRLLWEAAGNPIACSTACEAGSRPWCSRSKHRGQWQCRASAQGGPAGLCRGEVRQLHGSRLRGSARSLHAPGAPAHSQRSASQGITVRAVYCCARRYAPAVPFDSLAATCI